VVLFLEQDICRRRLSGWLHRLSTNPDNAGNPGGMGPAFGQILGLPVGDAGNSLSITFMYPDHVANTSVTLHDDFDPSGGAQ
jgi:hypothetical protein